MENYNNIINNNEYNAMVYGGNNMQQQTNTNIAPHHLQPAANSENIINLSYHQREPIIAQLPQSLGLYPNDQFQLQAQSLINHQAVLHRPPPIPQPDAHPLFSSVQQTEPRYVQESAVPVIEKGPSADYSEPPKQLQQHHEPLEENIPEVATQHLPEQEISAAPAPETQQMEVSVNESQSLEKPEQMEMEDEVQANTSGQQETEKPEEKPINEELETEIKNEEVPNEGEISGEPGDGEKSAEESESEEAEADEKVEPKQEEPEVDPNQCRVCKSTELLLDIFSVEYDMKISDLIMKICTNIRIHERDYLPHSICQPCLGKLRTAYDFKNTCEATDKELRQKLKRSKNKARKPSDFVLIDCNVFSESDDNDEENDDDFKVSEDEIESDESYGKKRKRQPTRRRPVKKSASRQSKGSRSRFASKSGVRSSSRNSGAVAVSSKKKAPEPAKAKSTPKPPDLTMSSKRLKRDIVYIEANYSSDDEVISPKKKRDTSGASAKEKEITVKEPVEKTTTTSEEKGKHICKECNKECSSKKALSAHRATSHFQPGEDAPFRCSICNRGFKYNINLTSHMQIHKDNYTCDCGKSFSNKGDLKKHTNSEHKNDNSITYECSKCKRFFSSLSRYEKHRESCTSVPSNHQKAIKISAPSSGVKKPMVDKRPKEDATPPTGKDLFKCVAPVTSTYWSDSFSD